MPKKDNAGRKTELERQGWYCKGPRQREGGGRLQKPAGGTAEGSILRELNFLGKELWKG